MEIVLAGPPCQGFSTAGRNDPGDERNVHVQRVAQLASRSGAKIIVIENVKGLLGAKYSTQLNQCIGTLRASGFTVTYRLFDLADYGVAQTRRRVIILGTRGIAPISFDAIPKGNTRTLKRRNRRPSSLHERTWPQATHGTRPANCVSYCTGTAADQRQARTPLRPHMEYSGGIWSSYRTRKARPRGDKPAAKTAKKA